MNRYDLGEVVRFRIEVRDIDDALVDPAGVSFIVEPPREPAEAFTWPGGDVGREAEGIFYYDLAITEFHGLWRYRWETTGDPQVAEESTFYVRPQDVAVEVGP